MKSPFWLSPRTIFLSGFIAGSMSLFASVSGYAQTLTEADFAKQITKYLANPETKMPHGTRFALKAITSQRDFLAFNVPTPSKEWANSRVQLACDKVTGDKIQRDSNGGYIDNQLFDISAPGNFSIPDDSGSYEEGKLPYIKVFFDECSLKRLPDSEITNTIREIVLKNHDESIRVGPTFTCADQSKCGPLSQLILARAHGQYQMGALDVGMVQPYQAMRALPEVDQNALRAEAGKFAQLVATQCRLPKRFKVEDVHGVLIIPDNMVQCVTNMYKRQKFIWVEKARSYNNSDLNEEIARSPTDHWFSQYLMLLNGFLPKQGWPETGPAPLDGSFGAGTRNSIRAVQAEAGLPTSGFMTNATFNYLLNRDTKKSASVTPINTSASNADVKYTGFRWDFHSWQGYATAQILNSDYAIKFSCEQLMPVIKITVERRGKEPGDGTPVSAAPNVRLQIASTNGAAIFGMMNGVAEAFGTMGTQELNKTFDLILRSREFNVEMPDLGFTTKFSTLNAKDAIESLREDCNWQ